MADQLDRLTGDKDDDEPKDEDLIDELNDW